MTIRVIELFAGIGAQHQALKDLSLDYEIIGISEIDKDAIKGYTAIHGDVTNFGDITTIEHLPECDLLTYSFPCTDISMAGKMLGFSENSGTRSSLLWEVGRLLNDYSHRGCLPEILLMENVPALLNRNNQPDFQKWLDVLDSLGYVNSYKVLNAVDYGVPQSRERVFMVSSLSRGSFLFPKPCPKKTAVKDILDVNDTDRYYLLEKHYPHVKLFSSPRINKIRSVGRIESYNYRMRQRIYDIAGPAPAIQCAGETTWHMISDNPLCIAKLSVREQFRAMGFGEPEIDKLLATLPKTAAHKVCGNSIAVCCLTAIFRGIYIDNSFVKARQTRLDEFICLF